MRSLLRNQQKIYYARIVQGDVVVDEWGNETSEHHKQYDSITPLWINVSPASGSVYNNPFGQSLNYDKKLSIADTSLFTEDYIGIAFWIGKEPPQTVEQDVFTHNYKLVGVASGLNELLVAVERVNVS